MKDIIKDIEAAAIRGAQEEEHRERAHSISALSGACHMAEKVISEVCGYASKSDIASMRDGMQMIAAEFAVSMGLSVGEFAMIWARSKRGDT